MPNSMLIQFLLSHLLLAKSTQIVGGLQCVNVIVRIYRMLKTVLSSIID